MTPPEAAQTTPAGVRIPPRGGQLGVKTVAGAAHRDLRAGARTGVRLGRMRPRPDALSRRSAPAPAEPVVSRILFARLGRAAKARSELSRSGTRKLDPESARNSGRYANLRGARTEPPSAFLPRETGAF